MSSSPASSIQTRTFFGSSPRQVPMVHNLRFRKENLQIPEKIICTGSSGVIGSQHFRSVRFSKTSGPAETGKHPADSDRFPYVPTFLSEFFSISHSIDHHFITISITNITSTCQQKTFSRLRLFSVVRSLRFADLTFD